jgi:hypothetical protein
LQESWGNLKQAFATAMIAVAKKIPETPTLEQITDISPAIPHLAELPTILFNMLAMRILSGLSSVMLHSTMVRRCMLRQHLGVSSV